MIYTDDPNLFSIADQASEGLAAKLSNEIEYKKADEGLAFHTSNARVVVLGKPAKRLEKYKAFEVSEADLPNRAISEFCKLADGMLQGCILMGLATIRKQSRKILTKFNSTLDAAFLSHRALGLPHEEAFYHIIPLLVDEIEAALEDSLPKPLIDNSVIEDWCKEKWAGKDNAKKFVPESVDVNEFAKCFCAKGMDIRDEYTIEAQSGLKKTLKKLKEFKWPSPSTDEFKQLTTYLCGDDNGLDLRELSVLMSQRTYC